MPLNVFIRKKNMLRVAFLKFRKEPQIDYEVEKWKEKDNIKTKWNRK